jgi:hypothetical protein
MTTTVQDLVRGALLLINVLDPGEAIPADEAADGLTVFNDMIASWPAQGIHTGIGESALTDPTPFEEYHTKGLKNLLAIELATQHATEPSAQVRADAKMGMQLIEADFKGYQTLAADLALQGMPSQRRW